MLHRGDVDNVQWGDPKDSATEIYRQNSYLVYNLIYKLGWSEIADENL